MKKNLLDQHASGSSRQGWVHWEYDPSEWAAFDQVGWEQIRNQSRLRLILSPIMYLVIMMVAWVLLRSSAPLVAAGVEVHGNQRMSCFRQVGKAISIWSKSFLGTSR